MTILLRNPNSPYQMRLADQAHWHLVNGLPLRYDGHLFRVVSVDRACIILEEMP